MRRPVARKKAPEASEDVRLVALSLLKGVSLPSEASKPTASRLRRSSGISCAVGEYLLKPRGGGGSDDSGSDGASSSEGSEAPEGPPLLEPGDRGRAPEPHQHVVAESAADAAEPQIRGSNVRYKVKGVDGRVIGCIVVNKVGNSLDAHCYRHHGKRPCSINRTFRRPAVKPKGVTQHRGRPLGFLIAWLRAGLAIPEGQGGRDRHFECSKCQGEFAFLANGCGHERKAARAWAAENLPTDLEAPKWDGEADEPAGHV